MHIYIYQWGLASYLNTTNRAHIIRGHDRNWSLAEVFFLSELNDDVPRKITMSTLFIEICSI
jgi:hypothetical protein